MDAFLRDQDQNPLPLSARAAPNARERAYLMRLVAACVLIDASCLGMAAKLLA